MIRTEGFSTLYAGLIPLWARQIPYTIIKFVTFEGIADLIYSYLPKKKSEMNTAEQLSVVFTAGESSIQACTFSQPASSKSRTEQRVQRAQTPCMNRQPLEPSLYCLTGCCWCALVV